VRVLVIGGTRFIGPPVVHRLADMGHEVTVFHRGLAEADLPPRVHHLHADRKELPAHVEAIRTFAPELVLDMAAFTQADAETMVQAVRGIAGRLVVLSSHDVYRAYGIFHGTEAGPVVHAPATEDSPLREQLYPYRGDGRGFDDYEKILVERAVAGIPGLPATILRLPMVYGEGDYQHRLLFELQRMDDGRPAIVLEERFALWRWTRGYVQNIAAAIALAVIDPRAAGRTYNLGEPAALSYADWVRVIGRNAGWARELLLQPAGRLPPALRPPIGNYDQHLIADTGRIRVELGQREPVARDEGLVRTIAWERANRPRDAAALLDYAAEDAVLASLGVAVSGSPGPPGSPGQSGAPALLP